MRIIVTNAKVQCTSALRLLYTAVKSHQDRVNNLRKRKVISNDDDSSDRNGLFCFPALARLISAVRVLILGATC